MTSEATMPNPADLLRKATNNVKELVVGIQQSQLSAPRPVPNGMCMALSTT